MVTVEKKLCLHNAHSEHELILEQCGLRVVIPGDFKVLSNVPNFA